MGAIVPVLDLAGGRGRGGHNVQIFALWTYGAIEMYFQYLKEKPGFTSVEARLELVRRLNEIPGVDIPADGITRRPSFPILLLQDPKALETFQRAIEWAIQTVKEGHSAAAARADD